MTPYVSNFFSFSLHNIPYQTLYISSGLSSVVSNQKDLELLSR